MQDAPGTLPAYQIAGVLRRAFSYMDPRLVRHGERVAFIAYEMALAAGERIPVDSNQLALLAVLHDIGAYKTEEIDRMVHFETEDVSAHSVFGYLFLKSTTSLSGCAEAVLYHHTPWSTLKDMDTPAKEYAALIHLADRVDILLSTSGREGLSVLRELSGSLFKPELVDIFEEADGKRRITQRLLDGGYLLLLEDWLRDFHFRDSTAMELLRMIVYAIDFRSPFTVTHTTNTTAISRELGRRLGLSPAEETALETGAFLHDIGKISIPVEILENPGRLTIREMDRMRTHVVVSDEIIRGLVSDEVCEIAIRHHEKCDGSGYPRGLTKEKLTLPQRILAVADIVSALIRQRSYKNAYPKERVVSILERMRDAGELCPEVCQTMLGDYDAIVDSAARQSDPVLRQYESMQRSFPELSQKVQALETTPL